MEQAKGNDMNEAEAFEAWCEREYGFTTGLMQDEARSGWQAALEWRDRQVGEAVAWRWKYEIPKEIGGGFAWQFASHWSTPPKGASSEPLYTSPPTGQINEQMREALEFFVDRFEPMRNELIFSKRLAIDKAKAALDAATPK